MGCNCRCKESCCSELVRPVGSWVALVTPFTNDDKVDMEGFARLVDFHVANGSDGVIFLGSTGEATSLSIDEKKEIIRAMAPYCKGKIPAYFGVTCPTTKDTVALAQLVEECGGDGVMMVVPPYIAPPQDAVYDYFATVAKSISIGVAIYNNPSRVIVNIDPETVIKLAEIPNVVADKEAMGNISQLAEIIPATKGKLNVLCCDFPKYLADPAHLGAGWPRHCQRRRQHNSPRDGGAVEAMGFVGGLQAYAGTGRGVQAYHESLLLCDQPSVGEGRHGIPGPAIGQAASAAEAYGRREAGAAQTAA